MAYRRRCGGVSVNHHTLSDVRIAHAGLVTLERVAQDGSGCARRHPVRRLAVTTVAPRVEPQDLRERAGGRE